MSPLLLGVLNIQAAGAGLGGATYYYTPSSGDVLFRDNSTSSFYAGGWRQDGYNKALLHKFNATITNQWTKQFDTGSNSYGRGIATDSSGNVYINGETTQNSFGGGFVAKFDSSGNIQWQKDVGSTAYPNSQYGLSVSGSVVASASIYYNGSNFFGPVNVSDLSGNQIRTNLFSANYYIRYSTSDSSYHYMHGEDAFAQTTYIAATNQGVTGRVWSKEDASGTIRGTQAPLSQSNSDILLSTRQNSSPYRGAFLRISKSNGSLSSADYISSPTGNSVYGRGYERDSSGNYYYVGLDNKTIQIVKTDSNNNVLWKRQIVNTNNAYVTSTSIDASNLYILTGTNDGTQIVTGVWSYPLDGSALGTASLGTNTITIEESTAGFGTLTGLNWSTGSASLSGTPFAWNYATSSYTITSPTLTWNEVA